MGLKGARKKCWAKGQEGRLGHLSLALGPSLQPAAAQWFSSGLECSSSGWLQEKINL